LHTLQYIAIQSEDKESAAHTVETLLNEELNPGHSWYDWFVVGGGRFHDGQDPYEETYETTISYEDTPDLFDTVISDCMKSKRREYQELYLDYKLNKEELEKTFEDWNGQMEFSMAIYPLKKMIDIMQGHWDYTSRFYDITSWSTNTHHMNRSLADGNKNWFLVPIDFHF
jgi:hypothetical protein